MFFRRKSLEGRFNCFGVYLTLIVFVISGTASPSGPRRLIGVTDEEEFFGDTAESILNKIYDIRQGILEDGEYSRDAETVVEAMCQDFEYPVKTRLEFNDLRGRMQSARFRRDDDRFRFSIPLLHPVEERTGDATAKTRFRRDDNTADTTRGGSSKDYMSTYYAQRKAIMEKYKKQQKKIMERLKQTQSLIAEIKKLKEAKKIDSRTGNETLARPEDPSKQNVTSYGDIGTTIPPDPTTSVSSDQTTSPPTSEVPKIVNDTREINFDSSAASFNSSEDEESDYSIEDDLPTSSSSPVHETLSPPANDKIEVTDRPVARTPEEDWPSESVNLIPHNEVDYNLTEGNFGRRDSDNETLIFDLGGHLTNPSRKNESALDQLEKMFLWDVQVGDERISRSDENETAWGVENSNIISNGDRSENSSRSSDSLRFKVEIKSSPEVQVTKNIKNVKTSTTTYRNSTHEIVEINGIVNSTKRIEPPSPKLNFTNPEAAAPTGDIGGGAKESEWCEECPHDYRWGTCEGTLFYQHNIFLRNRGPSAIDAIFGMNVQGPVSITCVEAIRYNQTRGIVTLHSGGPNHDFAKLRIRGFEGEGFSYIMKVWGVSNEEYVDSTGYAY